MKHSLRMSHNDPMFSTKDLNMIVEEVCNYAIEQGCSVGESISNYDVYLDDPTIDLVEEAALYILGSLSDKAFEERL